MRAFLALLLLIPSFSWGEAYKITNPGVIFISQDQLKLNIKKSGSSYDACNNEKNTLLEFIDLKVFKDKRGAEMGDVIRLKLNP